MPFQSDFGGIIKNGISIKEKPAVKEATSDDKVSFVKDLADILDKAGLAELEYKTEALAIRSRFSGTATVPVAQPVAPASVPARARNPATEAANWLIIQALLSPMAAPFTLLQNQTHPPSSRGTTSAGQPSYCRGNEGNEPNYCAKNRTVVKIFAQNAQPVEFGEALALSNNSHVQKDLDNQPGDVALRVLRACKELNIPSVAVHSTADADSMPVVCR